MVPWFDLFCGLLFLGNVAAHSNWHVPLFLYRDFVAWLRNAVDPTLTVLLLAFRLRRRDSGSVGSHFSAGSYSAASPRVIFLFSQVDILRKKIKLFIAKASIRLSRKFFHEMDCDKFVALS